jgi:L-rhamnose mutarotase
MWVPDWSAVLERMGASEVNRRWQEKMAPLFEPVPGLAPDEPFAMMQEVFFMPGDGAKQ